MSKGLDLLINSKAENVTSKSSKTSSVEAKKEGSSLFDSLLSSAKKDLKASLDNVEANETKIIKDSSSKTISLQQNLKTISTKLEDNNSKAFEENITLKESKTTLNNIPKNGVVQELKLDLNTNEQSSVKIKKSLPSMMDRLLQSAKQTFDAQNSQVSNESTEVKKVNTNEKTSLVDKVKVVELNSDEKKPTQKELSLSNLDKKITIDESLIKSTEVKTVKTEVLDEKSSKEIVNNVKVEDNLKDKKESIGKSDAISTLKTNSLKVSENELEKEVLAKRNKTEVSLENSDISKVDSKIKENIEVVLESKPKEVKEEVLNNKDNKVSLIDKILASAKEVKSEEKISLEKNEIKSTENTIVSTELKTKDSEKINPEKVVKSTIKDSSETITLNTLKDETKNIIEDNKIEKKVLKVEEKSNDISDKKIVQQNQSEKIVDTSSLTLDKNSSIKENEDIKNKTVSQEFPKTNSSRNETLDVNFTKESLNNTTSKNELAPEKTLKEENSNSKQVFAKTEEPVQVAKKISLEEMMKNPINNSDTLKQSKNDIVTNIYLSAQKKSLADNSLEVKSEAINTIKNAKSTKDIEKGAKALNLGLEKQEVTIEKPIEELKNQKNVSSSTFDKLALFRNNVKDSLENKTAVKSSLDVLSQNIVKSEDIEEKVVELSVNIATTPTLQNRIVAARQQMATMMSDLARTMYENYKPPVTAFRINLNPSSLGSIAIVLRNEQKNSLSISMNISNHSTKEIMIENQGSLRDSLSKTFDGTSNFNLNFDASEESYNSANQENNSNENFENEFLDSSSIVSNKQNENNEEVEDNLNYM